MKNFKVTGLVFSMLLILGVSTQAQAQAAPQRTWDYLGVVDRISDSYNACLNKADSQQSISQCKSIYKAEFIATAPVGMALGAGFTEALITLNPVALAGVVTAYLGDTIGEGAYNIVNASTVGALKALGNDPSLEGSYLWNQEHLSDPSASAAK
jgi:hypothetical protein